MRLARKLHSYATRFARSALSDDLVVDQYMRDIEATTSQLTIIGPVTHPDYQGSI